MSDVTEWIALSIAEARVKKRRDALRPSLPTQRSQVPFTGTCRSTCAARATSLASWGVSVVGGEGVPMGAMGLFLARASSLAHHVKRVAGLIPKKKMPGVYARRVVAVMENAQPGRDGPEVEFPTDTVGQCDCTANPGPHPPISTRVTVALPFPASTADHLHLLPEAFRECALLWLDLPTPNIPCFAQAAVVGAA